MTTPTMTAEFEDVLMAEQLADVPSAFGNPDFCDEVPLYSRYQQIDFLKQFGDVDRSLLELGLDYLDRLMQDAPTAADGWAALSVTRDGPEEPLVPAVFVCRRNAAQRLSALRLGAPPTTEFGRQVQDIIKRARPHSHAYSVFEDTQTTAGEVRVFISKQVPPWPVLLH